MKLNELTERLVHKRFCQFQKIKCIINLYTQAVSKRQKNVRAVVRGDADGFKRLNLIV